MGRVSVDYVDKSHALSVNESPYHDKEIIHASENPGDSPLELIEVQQEATEDRMILSVFRISMVELKFSGSIS